MKIVQYTTVVVRGDAVSNDCLSIDDFLKKEGYDTAIYVKQYAENTPRDRVKACEDFSGLKEDDLLIFHMSIFTGIMDRVREAKCKKIMIYHNITPPLFFSKYNAAIRKACFQGLREVQESKDVFSYIICDSEFNRQDLIDYGYTCPIDVVPLLIPFSDYKQEPDPGIIRQYNDGMTNILFVGRLAPNKKQEDVIAAFDCYRRNFNPESRLILVGSDNGTEKYTKRLKDFIEQNEIENVVFPGHISFSAILAMYSTADIFLCMSEHEGFCVPLTEAMCFDIPIIAYDSCAIPYTLKGSGLLLKDKSPGYVASAIDTVVKDEELRKDIIKSQRERLKDFDHGNVAPVFLKKIQDFLAGGAPAADNNSKADQTGADSGKERIAFVCQRYGEEIIGGSESECRMYAERLTPYYDVDVITTCALDYITWKNHYPEGESVLNGVNVKRFRVTGERRQDLLGAVANRVAKKHKVRDEEKWIESQGPVTLGLVQYLHDHGMEYKAVIFMTYLYYTTERGIRNQFRDIIFVPTAHDEWPIYMNVFKDVFDRPSKFIYNSEGERRFVEKMFPSAAGKPKITVGLGVDSPASELPEISTLVKTDAPYVCYCGRIDKDKGCPELFEYFKKYKDEKKTDIKIVLTGNKIIDIPDRDDIIYLGFVSDEEKFSVMKHAVALMLPSRNESLSIVVLESMMMGTPVLVNGHCEVLKDHCEESGAGYYYLEYAGFKENLEKILNDKEQYKEMQENGKKYVETRYNWDSIIKQITDLINM